MKKKYRIKRGDEFEAIIHHKRYVTSGSFIVYTKAKKEAVVRVGISVPKKLGNAVLRNKTKRQVREMIREIDVFQGNKDLIIIVRKQYFRETYDECRKDLEKLIKKAKI